MNEMTMDIKNPAENFSVKPVRMYPRAEGTYEDLKVGDIIKVLVVYHDKKENVVFCENKLGSYFIKDENFCHDKENLLKTINCYMHQYIVARVVSIRSKGLIELDRKHLLIDTIETLKDQIGTVVPATIENIVQYGLFVDIGNGIRSLCYISNISKCRYQKLYKIFTNGEQVMVKIMDFDPYTKNFMVSRKDAYKRRTFNKYDEIVVMISDETEKRDGYYVEIDPATSGIMDKYPEMPDLQMGDYCYVSVSKDTPRGARVKFIYKVVED